MEEHREIVDDVKQATDAITTEATTQAKAAFGNVAQEGKLLASALGAAADQAERDGARVVQEPLRQLAAFCQRIADKTENQGPKQMFTELEDFGRREPMMLFGAAALLGFLGTRALRAGTQARSTATAAEAADAPQPGMGWA